MNTFDLYAELSKWTQNSPALPRGFSISHINGDGLLTIRLFLDGIEVVKATNVSYEPSHAFGSAIEKFEKYQRSRRNMKK